MTLLNRLTRTVQILRDRLLATAFEPLASWVLHRRETGSGSTVPFAVYFADNPSSVYQLQQWVLLFEKLSETSGQVQLLIRHPRVALYFSNKSNLPVLLARTSTSVEEFVSSFGVRVMFYVNNNQANFTTLRINGVSHIYLSHGESEKKSMYSHQLRAYDFVFIAGQASEDRIAHHVSSIERKRLIHIGRPQLSLAFKSKAKLQPAVRRRTILYAPTWEGDGKGMEYSSLLSHGVDLIEGLMKDARFRIVFRPHPKTGANSRSHQLAVRRIQKMLSSGHSRDVGHQFDSQQNALESIEQADAVVCDVSSIAMDAVGLNTPIVLCAGQTTIAGGLSEHVPTWTGSTPSNANDILMTLASNPAGTAQNAYKAYIFDPTSPRSAENKFIQTASLLLEGDSSLF